MTEATPEKNVENWKQAWQNTHGREKTGPEYSAPAAESLARIPPILPKPA